MSGIPSLPETQPRTAPPISLARSHRRASTLSATAPAGLSHRQPETRLALPPRRLIRDSTRWVCNPTVDLHRPSPWCLAAQPSNGATPAARTEINVASHAQPLVPAL